MPTPLRIFVSSPGDVIPERRRAHLVIEKLAKEYARFFSIKAVLWEVEPMLASGHFQDQIVAPSETDILLLVVWSRLGTALPALTETREYRGIDGRTPVTGTEWEFEDALAAQKRRGAPDVLAYRKQADPTVSLRDRAAKASAEEQWDRLDLFWNRWFVNKGEFVAAFSEFDDLDGFEAKLESDLRALIDRRIQALTAGGHEDAAPTWLKGSPFRGLEFYRIEHAPIFFGRSAVTKASVEQLTQTSEAGCAFLLVLGASGAGKSSLAQAGILPALTGRGIVPRVGHWRHAVVRPGAHPDGPFVALAEAITGETALPELLAGNQSASALARHLQAAADDPSFPIVSALNQIEVAMRQQGDLLQIECARLAIVVDQLEELFTVRDTTSSDRAAFVRCLNGLARSGCVFVIATMRSDYWHRAAETPLLVDMAAGLGRIDLLAAARDEIIEMIRQPAQAAGVDFEADPVRNVKLDAALATEAEASPGAMPLLSFLLDEIYKRDIGARHLSTLTYESMRQLGGLRGAIANRAEAVFLGLPAGVQATLPRVLRSLVTVGRAGAAATSRDASMSRFAEGGAEYQLIQALLDPQVRLLVVEGDGEGARVRLAHEALITNWERARRQIEQDRDDLRTRAAVEDALAEWRAAPQSAKRDYLLRDPLLANAIDLTGRWREEFAAETLAFIQASRRRARVLFQLTVAAAAVFAIVAVGAVVATYLGHQAKLLAEAERARAETQEARALTTQSRFLVNQSTRVEAAGFHSTAMALSLEALPDPRRGNDRPYIPEAERSLFSAAQSPHERFILRDHTWTITNVAFSPDGKSLLSSSWDHTVRVWDAATWKPKLVLDDKAGAITVATFSPDGRFILAAPNDGTARIFDASTGAVVHRLAGAKDELTYGSYSPDGKRILIASGDKSPRLWNAQTGTLITALAGNEDRVVFGAFAGDSSRLVTVSADNVVHAYSATDGKPLYTTPPQQAIIKEVGFSPDGRYLVTESDDGALRVWDAKTGGPIRSMTGPPGAVMRMAFSADGTRIAASYDDKTARIWLIASGEQLFELTGHESYIWSIAFSPDDKFVATASMDTTARLWDAANGRPITIFRGHKSPVRRAVFSPDGKWLVTASGEGINPFSTAHEADNTVRVWSTTPEFEVGAIKEKNRILSLAALSPDGRFAVVTDTQGIDSKSLPVSARIWDPDTRDEILELPIDPRAANVIASTDGSRVATIDRSGSVSLWDPAAATRVTTIESEALQATALAFSPDGALLVAAEVSKDQGNRSHEIRIVRAVDGAPVRRLQGDMPDVLAIAISSDNKWLLALSESDVRIWSLTDDRPPKAIALAGRDSQVAFVEGAGTIVTLDNDGHAATWQIETGKQVADWPSVGVFPKSVISTDGSSIVSYYTDQSSMLRLIHQGTAQTVSLADNNDCEGSFVLSSDGQRLLSYSNSGVLCLRDARDGRLLAKSPTELGTVSAAVCSGGCDLAVIGTEDGTVFLWDTKSAGPPRPLKGHRGKVTDAAFLRDDKQLVTVSLDGSARFWEIASGKQIQAIENSGRGLASVSVLAGGRRILALSSKEPATSPGTARIVEVDGGKVVSRIALAAKYDQGIPIFATDSFAFSRAGDRLLFQSSIGDPTLFEIPSGNVAAVIKGDTDPPAASLAPDGVLASLSPVAGNDNMMHPRLNILDAAGNNARAIPTPDSFESVNFSPDGKLLLFGNHLLSPQTGEEWVLSGEAQDAMRYFSPNGNYLASISKDATPDDPLLNAAVAWNPITGKTGALMQGDPGTGLDSGPSHVSALAISSDGQTAVVAFNDNTIKFWNPNTGRQLGTIDHLGEGTKSDLLNQTTVRAIAFSPDAKRAALAGDSGDHSLIRAVNVADRTEVGNVAGPAGAQLVRFSPDGRWMAASGGATFADKERIVFRVWNAVTLKPIPALDWSSKDSNRPDFAFSPDGRFIVRNSSGDQAVVLDIETGKTIATLRGHGSQVTKVAFSPDGQEIATVAGGDKIHLWNATTFAETVIQTGYGRELNDILYFPDGRTLAAASESGAVGIWDVKRQVQVRKLSDGAPAKKLFMVANGTALVAVTEDKTIRTWKIETGEELAHFSYRTGIAAVDAAGGVVVSAAAQQFEDAYRISVWNTADRHKLSIQHEQQGEFLPIFSPDGRYLLLMARLVRDSPTEVWDLVNEKMIGKLETENGVRAASFSPNGDLILTRGSKDEAQIWHSADAHPVGTIVASRMEDLADIFNKSMERADFVFGGSRILTYSSNHLLHLWDTASLQLRGTIELADGDYKIAMDGERLIFSQADGIVRISRLTGNLQELVDFACERLAGPLTVAERREYALDPEPEHYPCGVKPPPEIEKSP